MKPENLKKFWFGLIAVVVMLLFWVRMTVQSTQLSYRIRDLEGSIQKEQRRRSDLEIQKDQYISLHSIEDVAKKKLGLVTPSNESVILMPASHS